VSERRSGPRGAHPYKTLLVVPADDEAMRPSALETRAKSPRCSSSRRLLSLFARILDRSRRGPERRSGPRSPHTGPFTVVVSTDDGGDQAFFSRKAREVTALHIVSLSSLVFRVKSSAVVDMGDPRR
jgi:hypothetical protein